MLRNLNIKEGKIDLSDRIYLDPEFESQHRRKRLQRGDVLTVRTGYAGVTAAIPDDLQGAQCFTSLVTRPKPDRIDSRFLAFYLNSPFGEKAFTRSEAGGGQKNVNAGALEVLRVPVPPLPEQKAIADTLSTWDTAIETMERLIAAKERGLVASLDNLVFKSRTNGWKLVPLGEAFRERSESGREDLPLLSISRESGVTTREETNRKDTSSEDKSKYLRICPGDIGYNTMRMWQGVSALSGLDGIVSPAYTICIPNECLILGEYAAFLFKHPRVVHQFYRHSQGLTSDTWNLKFPHFAEIRVWLPSLVEQRDIVGELQVANKELTLLRKPLDLLKHQKRGLMQRLLTGAWRVPIPQEAP